MPPLPWEVFQLGAQPLGNFTMHLCSSSHEEMKFHSEEAVVPARWTKNEDQRNGPNPDRAFVTADRLLWETWTPIVCIKPQRLWEVSKLSSSEQQIIIHKGSYAQAVAEVLA